MIAKIGCFAALAGLAVGCSNLSGPPCAQVSAQFPLANASPLALTSDVKLMRAGDGFLLAGLDGHTVRWGRLSEDGAIIGESAFALPELPAVMPDGRRLGPVFAFTRKVVPGDQLIAAMLVEKAGSPNTYEVHAYVHDQGAITPPALHVLGDLVASAQSGSIRLVAGSPVSGKIALLLWGTEGQAAPITYQALGADGAATGGPRKLLDDVDPTKIPRWRSLDITQSRGIFAVTVVEDGIANNPPLWHRFDLNDDGNTQAETLIYIRWGQVADDRIVSSPTPIPGGYLVVWQTGNSNGGTYFARMSPPLPDASSDVIPEVSSNALLSSENFGGYSRMPKLLWANSAGSGYEFLVGMLGAKGPEVRRYNLLSDPKGSLVRLPTTAGQVGPVSAWDGPDGTWMTYLDQPAAKTGSTAAAGTRLLVKVSPSEPL